MIARKEFRREVRLDEEHQRLLEEELARRNTTFTAWLREKIEADREERERSRRRAALESMFRLFDDDPIQWPPWDELKKELNHAACPGGDLCDEPQYH